MNTDIEFLSLLEEDLRIIAELESEVESPRVRPRAGRRRLVAAVAAALILAAGGLGYFVRGLGGDDSSRNNLAGWFGIKAPTAGTPVPYGPSGGGQKIIDQPLFGFIPGRDVQRGIHLGKPAGNPPATGTATAVKPKIIRTADLDVQVKRGRFDEAFRDASLVADRYGGYIAASSMGGSDAKTGSITMRVPAGNFSRAVADLSALGETLQERIRGEDVTADYVDLQGRIKTWTAQERVLLRLMADAQSIDETLTVQRHLQDVQLQIERLKGQLRVLRDQVADGTITLSLHEPLSHRQEAKTPPISRGFGDTWRRAAGGFLDVIATVAIGLGYLAPIAALAMGIWLLVRRRIRVRA